MNLLKENIEDLMIKANFMLKENYKETKLNKLLTYWMFFEENEQIIQEITNEPLEVILYSKFYWCVQFKKLYEKLYNRDVGIEQQQFQIIEELDTRLCGNVDWNLLQKIEKENI